MEDWEKELDANMESIRKSSDSIQKHCYAMLGGCIFLVGMHIGKLL